MKKSDTVPLKRLLPAFGLAAVLIVGLVAMEVLLPRGRIATFSTPDEQMYVVQGAESDRALIPSAMASLGEDEVLSTSTADPDELNAFLGFTPLMPTHIPSGWELDQYEGHITQTDWMFLMILHNEKEEHTLTYQVTASTTYDGFGLAFHQNETGSRIQLPNGLEGYLAYNYDDILITWLDGLTCYDISGPISSEEALNMIESIK